MDVMHPVIEIEGQEWVADTSKILASLPPKYTLYSLQDKEVKFLPTNDLAFLNAKRYMLTHELFEFLNPGTVTVTQTSGTALVDQHGNVVASNGIESNIVASIQPRPDEEEVLGLEMLFYKECDLKDMISEVVESHAELLIRLGRLDWERERLKNSLETIANGLLPDGTSVDTSVSLFAEDTLEKVNRK